MCKRRKELFNLRVSLLLASRVIKQCQAAANQRCDQNAAFPQEHLRVPLKLIGLFDVKLVEQVELTQTKDHPPHGERDGEGDPEGHQQNLDSIASPFHPC